MTVFEELRSATEAARNEQELPDFLAERIFGIIKRQEQFNALETDIACLTEQVRLYDTYGQTGYLGMGVNSVILEKTLKRLEAMCVRTDWPEAQGTPNGN